MTVVTPSEYGLITTLIVTYSFLIPFFSSGIDSSILRFYNKKMKIYYLRMQSF